MASKAQVKKFNGNYFLNIQNFLPEEVMGGLLESCDELITKIKKDQNVTELLLSSAWFFALRILDGFNCGALTS